jgi:Family of unknown function (DUF5950)
MAATSEELVLIRQIQGLTVLLSCLPAGGKARELFSMALELDEGPVLDRAKPPDDPDDDDGMRAWLESHWAQDAVSDDEQRIVDWQADSDNMAAAIAELQAVAAKVRPA